MSQYKCDRCDRLFTRKENLAKHTLNNVCVGKRYESVIDSNNQFKCEFCGKTFTTSTSMYRHVNHTCKIKKTEDRNRDQIYERLVALEKRSSEFEQENKQLKKKMVTLEKNTQEQSTVTNNTTLNTNNTNNINNGIVAHINLIGYGKEDLSKIDKMDILRAIQSGYDSTIKLTETLHFNPKYPEYHNIYITNVKDKYAMMYDGKDWNLTMKEELINKIYDDKKNYIEENIDEFIESLTTSRKKALDRWLETDDADERIIKVKNEIKLLLYNKRNLIIDSYDDTTLKKQKLCGKKQPRRSRKDISLDNES